MCTTQRMLFSYCCILSCTAIIFAQPPAVPVVTNVPHQDRSRLSMNGSPPRAAHESELGRQPEQVPANMTSVSDGGIAGVCGQLVYDNSAPSNLYQPTNGSRIADDCALDRYERDICEISSRVVNNNGFAASVILELWDACPQDGGNLLLTSPSFPLAANSATDVSWSVGSITVGNVVWVAWRSPNANVGPFITGAAFPGFTEDRFGTDNCGGSPSCNCYYSGNPYAGLDVTISAACGTPPCPECPAESIDSQLPIPPVTAFAYTSEADPGYVVYEDFVGLTQPICDIHFWGIQGEYDGGFTPCIEDPSTFDVTIYEDAGGIPGAVACTYTLSASGVNSGFTYDVGPDSYPLREWEADLQPCCDVSSGWVSIQGVSGPACWFLWAGSIEGNFAGLQSDGITTDLLPTDLAMCLTGKNNLVLEADACPDDAFPGEAGYQITVELWMRNLTQTVTGFQGFLQFDDAALTYRGDLSTYTNSPFGLHIRAINDAQMGLGAGELNVDGSIVLGGVGSSADSLLATLVFDVEPAGLCSLTSVGYRTVGPFQSELSFGGAPVATGLVVSPGMTLDDTPPSFVDFPSDENLQCVGDVSPANIALLTAVDDCLGAVIITHEGDTNNGGAGCPGDPLVISRTYRATDECGNYLDQVQTITVVDSMGPMIDTFPSDMGFECEEDVPASDTGLVSATDNCPGMVTITHLGDAASGSGCLADPLVITRTYRATDACGNVTDQDQTFTVVDVTSPEVTCPGDVVVNADAGGCSALVNVGTVVETFDNTPPLSVGQAAGYWYVDRYAPAGFSTATFDGGLRLKHSISSADSAANRPPAYSSGFYDTQGRKYDLNLAIGATLGIDLYIPSEWSSDVRRADLWATTLDANNDISGFPIIGFTSNDPNDALNPNPANPTPRFRVFTQDTDNDGGNGYTPGWVDLGLPVGFVYDQWVHLQITLTSASFEFVVMTAQGNLAYTDNITFDSIQFANTIVQAFNFGESYDVYWDNVTLPAAATDNCDGSVVITYERSDNAALTLADPFPTGTTTVTWTATDACGNTDTCEQDITVNAVTDVAVTVELFGVSIPCTRCIRFVPTPGDCSAEDVHVLMNFIDHDSNPATPVRATQVIQIPCGARNALCAKDEQHTLWSTVTLTDAGPSYVADSVISLLSGDTDNDGDVDINDVTWLLFTFSHSAVSGGCPFNGLSRDADFSNNGVVGTSDYDLLAGNWLQLTSCACSSAPLHDGGIPTSGMDQWQGSIAAGALPVEMRAKVDLNNDQIVDYRDVKLFETRNGLSHRLSDQLKRMSK